jgi:Transposase
MLNYLQRWIDQLRWQRLEPFLKLAKMLLEHLDGILNYCRTKVPLGVVEAVNANIKSLPSDRPRNRRGAVVGPAFAYYVAGGDTRTCATCCARRTAKRRPRPNLWSSGRRPKMRVPSNSGGEPKNVNATGKYRGRSVCPVSLW